MTPDDSARNRKMRKMMSLNCSICLMPISGVGKVYRIWTPKGGPPQYSSRFRLVEDASYSGNGVTDAFGSVMVFQEHFGTFFWPAPCAFWRIRLNNWVDMLVFSFKGGRKCQIDCTKGNQHFPSKKHNCHMSCCIKVYEIFLARFHNRSRRKTIRSPAIR